MPTIDYEPEVNVFGLFILNNNQKTIWLEQTYKVTDYLPEFRGIEDAEVKVTTSSQRVFFTHLFNGRYVDDKDELVLEAGETYYLDIVLNNGHKITAQCVMPDKPSITSPQYADTVAAYRALEVSWNHAEFADRYELSIYNFNRTFTFSTLSDSDSEELFAFLFAKPDEYMIKLTAMDRNYYDHTRSRSNREKIHHIEGAMGVFGAIAYDYLRIYAK